MYNHKTRIGNWNEDMELKSIKTSDFKSKTGAGEGKFNATLSNVQHHYGVVPWTHSADGCLHDGDSVMLKNKKVDGHLVADISSKVVNVDEAYRLTTSKN